MQDHKCFVCGKNIKITNARYIKSKTKKFTCSTYCMGISYQGDNNIQCDNCGRGFHRKPSHIKSNNFCSMRCIGEYKSKNNCGNSNGNKRYKFDTNYFNEVDTEFKGWLLGWIASDGSIRNNSICIQIHLKDLDVLEQIKSNFCTEIPIKYYKTKNQVAYTINSKKIVHDVLKHLNLLEQGKKHDKLTLPKLALHILPHFIRGFFEGDGHIRKKNGLECGISSSSEQLLIDIANLLNTKNNLYRKVSCKTLTYYGDNAKIFLDYIYNRSMYKMTRKYNLYLIRFINQGDNNEK